MASKEKLFASLEKAYENARKQECEELHNALVQVIGEQRATIQNILMVLELIKFELLEAKYKEVMGVVKLTEKKAPVKKIEKDKE